MPTAIEKLNTDRLMRAIRALQHIQRTNAPNTSLCRAATKALAPLLKEHAARTQAEAGETVVAPAAAG